MWGQIMAPYNLLKSKYEKALGMLPKWLSPWVRDIVDVGTTVAVIILVLKLLLGADMLVPLVVVTSQSMQHESHDNSWMVWMEKRGMDDGTIASFPLSNGFSMGDMIVVTAPTSGLGDVIIYERDLHHLNFSSTDPIIHRVVGVAHVRDYNIQNVEGSLDCLNKKSMMKYVKMVEGCQVGDAGCPYTRYPEGGDFKLFVTKGDNNVGSDQCNIKLNIAYPVNDAQVTGKALLRLPFLGWPKIILTVLFRVLTLQF